MPPELLASDDDGDDDDGVRVELTDDAARALDGSESFLLTRPVEHNLILTILHGRVAAPLAGRYWIARVGHDVVGVALQSPIGRSVVVTPGSPTVACALAHAVADTDTSTGGTVPGVGAEASTAAAFAGAWTDRREVGARPVDGMRLCRLGALVPPVAGAGRLRVATADDRATLRPWMLGFLFDTRQDRDDVDDALDRMLDAGRLWVWEVGGVPVSMCADTLPIAEVVRISAVYTPSDERRRGYAAAVVAALSASHCSAGHIVVLYADLGNPTSNGVYRRIGFRVVHEVVDYRFDDA